MGPITVGAIFFTVWWTVLFAVLPWGVRAQGRAEPGTVESAPQNPRLLMKFAVTTALSAAITLGIYLLYHSDLISFREMAKGL